VILLYYQASLRLMLLLEWSKEPRYTLRWLLKWY
jgi:hypothetical protein